MSFDPISIAYAAGLFEGEGSVSAVTYYYARGEKRERATPQLKIQISMTDLEPLQRFHSTFGGRIYGPYTQRPDTLPQWKLRIDIQDQATEALIAMYPLLSPRRQQKIDEVLKLRKEVAA